MKAQTSQLLKTIMDGEVENTEEFERTLRKELSTRKELMDKVFLLAQREELKYNNAKFNLAINFVEDEVITSPHLPLLNIILGEEDMIIKMRNLQRFISHFTNSPYVGWT